MYTLQGRRYTLGNTKVTYFSFFIRHFVRTVNNIISYTNTRVSISTQVSRGVGGVTKNTFLAN